MHQLGRRIAAVTGERWATDYLFQRLGVAIQRSNYLPKKYHGKTIF